MRLRELTSLLVLATSLASPAAATQTVSWSDLVDKSVRQYEDSYRSLLPSQLELLISISRLRDRMASSARTGEDRSTIEQQLRMKEAKLAAKGINVDWLISQRWAVAKQRERAATGGNKDLDGQAIIIAGFPIPAPADADGMQVAYMPLFFSPAHRNALWISRRYPNVRDAPRDAVAWFPQDVA
jgi:hypothetical protein